MKRTNIYLTEQLITNIERDSKRTGEPKASIIRSILNKYYESEKFKPRITPGNGQTWSSFIEDLLSLDLTDKQRKQVELIRKENKL